jgi:hypothetical protein
VTVTEVVMAFRNKSHKAPEVSKMKIGKPYVRPVRRIISCLSIQPLFVSGRQTLSG